MCMVLRSVSVFLYHTEILKNKMIDLKLVTASDYTVHGNIPKQVWNHFLNENAIKMEQNPDFRSAIEFRD